MAFFPIERHLPVNRGRIIVADAHNKRSSFIDTIALGMAKANHRARRPVKNLEDLSGGHRQFYRVVDIQASRILTDEPMRQYLDHFGGLNGAKLVRIDKAHFPTIGR